MKLLTSILSIYILLIAVIPCCSFDECAEEKMELSAQHDAGEDDCGSCSPFFNCDGCATAAVSYEASSLPKVEITGSAIYNDFLTPSLSSIANNYWQPPRFI